MRCLLRWLRAGFGSMTARVARDIVIQLTVGPQADGFGNPPTLEEFNPNFVALLMT